MEKTINIHNNANIQATGEINSKHCKPVICIETGEVFTSVTDAAKAIECYAPDLSSHLTGKKRSIKGKHFCYLTRATESLDAIVTRLRETSSMEEDARKWREYQAEQERKRKEEEARIEAERKAKEEYEAAVVKAKDKVARRKTICERMEAKLTEAEKRLMEAEAELAMLVDVNNENEEEVA